MRPDRRPAEEIANDPIVRMQCKLLAAGFPFDVVDTFGENELLGLCVVVGELDGGVFDWSTYTWESPRSA